MKITKETIASARRSKEEVARFLKSVNFQEGSFDAYLQLLHLKNFIDLVEKELDKEGLLK